LSKFCLVWVLFALIELVVSAVMKPWQIILGATAARGRFYNYPGAYRWPGLGLVAANPMEHV